MLSNAATEEVVFFWQVYNKETIMVLNQFWKGELSVKSGDPSSHTNMTTLQKNFSQGGSFGWIVAAIRASS